MVEEHVYLVGWRINVTIVTKLREEWRGAGEVLGRVKHEWCGMRDIRLWLCPRVEWPARSLLVCFVLSQVLRDVSYHK